jgi:hypothetical protein
MDTKKMRACAPLLPPPGDEVVVQCLNEIERLRAVVDAAQEWGGERSVSDWDEADLMKALWTFNGDRNEPCPECDGECGEPCAPCAVMAAHAAIDAQLDELVRRGKLHIGEPIAGLGPNV